MRTIRDCALEVLIHFHRGMHLTPEQNRALESLIDAIDNTTQAESERSPGGIISEDTEKLHKIAVWCEWMARVQSLGANIIVDGEDCDSHGPHELTLLISKFLHDKDAV